MELSVNRENINIFQALASESRLKIIEILKEEEKNIRELAEILKMSSTIIVRHIAKLEKAEIIKTVSVPGKRGIQKICRLNIDKILFNFKGDMLENDLIAKLSIPVGHYLNYSVQATCGIADKNSLIGLHDDPRYFSHPDHYKAGIVWFTNGWVEYAIPSYILDHKEIKTIKIALELCSEYPCYKNDYKSDIYFYLGDVHLGKWTAPGNFGDRRGKYNPPWWTMGSEYGIRIELEVNQNGAYIEKKKVSNVSIESLKIEKEVDLKLKIETPEKTEFPGGINIFGRGFGDYNQDIEVTIEYL